MKNMFFVFVAMVIFMGACAYEGNAQAWSGAAQVQIGDPRPPYPSGYHPTYGNVGSHFRGYQRPVPQYVGGGFHGRAVLEWGQPAHYRQGTHRRGFNGHIVDRPQWVYDISSGQQSYGTQTRYAAQGQPRTRYAGTETIKSGFRREEVRDKTGKLISCRDIDHATGRVIREWIVTPDGKVVMK